MFRDKPLNLEFEIWNYGLGTTQGYQLDQSLRLFKSVFDNVLLESGGLCHVLPLAVCLE